MKILKNVSTGALATLTLCTIVGASIGIVYADDASSALSCDQITAAMKAYPSGSSGYMRMLDQYNRLCLDIKAGCPSQIQLDSQAKVCANAAMYFQYYTDPSSCKQVRCSLTPPVSSSSSAAPQSSSSAVPTGPCPIGDVLTNAALACKNKNLLFEYATINGCKQVVCIDTVSSQGSCPAPDTLTVKAASCKSQGYDYEYYTVGVCRMIRCTNEAVGSSSSCAGDDSINASAMQCQKKGMTPAITSDANGCRQVACAGSFSSATSSCPSDDQLNQNIQVCKNSGLTYTTMPDNNNCRQVYCQSFSEGDMTGDMTSSSSSSAVRNPFPDVDSTTLAGQAAIELYRRGVIAGFPDGTFKGDQPVNRAEAAKFLLLACGKNTSAPFSGSLSDVADGQWYTPFVEAAAKLGVISGYPDGTFKPGNTVIRAEFLKMLTNACGLQSGLPYAYKDVSTTDWFASFAGSAETYDLFPNAVTLLQPGALMSRTDTAIALYEYLTHR